GGDAAGERDMAGMKSAWAAAGRPEGELVATAFVTGAVLAPGEAVDSPRAKAQAGPGAAVALHNLVENQEHGADLSGLPAFLRDHVARYREVYLAYKPEDARYLTLHRGHLMFLRPEEEPLISPELIGATTFTAIPDVLVERIRELGRAGYTQFALQ